jgi:hypothetical protein
MAAALLSDIAEYRGPSNSLGPIADIDLPVPSSVRRDAEIDRNGDGKRKPAHHPGVTAEGDRVAAEMKADGASALGKEYHNEYHDLLEVRDGKMEAGGEYLDTAHAQEVIVVAARASARCT